MDVTSTGHPLAPHTHGLRRMPSWLEDLDDFEPSWPNLRLYEAEYRRAKRSFRAGGRRDGDDHSSIHLLSRFLDEIKGFHKGKLDLSGRHEHVCCAFGVE